jgi:hypothetical protein
LTSYQSQYDQKLVRSFGKIVTTPFRDDGTPNPITSNTSTPTCRHSFYLAIPQTKIIRTRTFTGMHIADKQRRQKLNADEAKITFPQRDLRGQALLPWE